MSWKRMAVLVVLIAANPAFAGVSYITLDPEEPGPYPADGRTITVWTTFNNREGQDVLLRQLSLDFSATAPELELPAVFGSECYDCFEEYLKLLYLPRIDIVYTGIAPSTTEMISLENGGAVVIGAIDVTLPTTPGTYTLDAINAAATDLNSGAYFSYGFDPRVELHHSLGNLAGGTVDLVVVPEPATLVLFGIGGMAFVTRRLTRRRRSGYAVSVC